MASALLLNASYEPLCAVSWQRAVVLVVSGVAEIIEHDEERLVRSERMHLPWPKVVRLFRYVRAPRNRRVPLTREGVLARDKRECAYCGKHATTIDHVVPRSRGGAHTWENLVACCKKCNNKKDNHTLEELGWKLRFDPYVPRGRLVLVARDPSWDMWINPQPA